MRNGVRCKDPSPARFPWDPVLLGSTAMHHSVRSPVTHRGARTRVPAPTARTQHTTLDAHRWSINAHTLARSHVWVRVHTRRHIAMERRGRTDIWPEVNDVSNLTLLDKILRDAGPTRGGLARPCVNRNPLPPILSPPLAAPPGQV